MKWSRVLLLLFVLLLAGSGIALEVLKPADDFALPHPLNGVLRQLHGWSLQFALLLLGYFWASHIQKKWRQRHKHWDGVLNLLCWLSLTISGLLLYYPFEWFAASWSQHWHWYSGVLWLLVLLLHVSRYFLAGNRRPLY